MADFDVIPEGGFDRARRNLIWLSAASAASTLVGAKLGSGFGLLVFEGGEGVQISTPVFLLSLLALVNFVLLIRIYNYSYAFYSDEMNSMISDWKISLGELSQGFRGFSQDAKRFEAMEAELKRFAVTAKGELGRVDSAAKEFLESLDKTIDDFDARQLTIPDENFRAFRAFASERTRLEVGSISEQLHERRQESADLLKEFFYNFNRASAGAADVCKKLGEIAEFFSHAESEAKEKANFAGFKFVVTGVERYRRFIFDFGVPLLAWTFSAFAYFSDPFAQWVVQSLSAS